MTNANDLAHPTNIIDPDRYFTPQYHTGLTKREYFAAMAMQGLMAHGWNIHEYKDAASCSTKAADALINALNETK